MPAIRTLPLITTLFLCTACASTDANHLGNPVLWPIMAVTSGLDNAGYDARRQRVSGYVRTNHAILITQIRNGGGPELKAGFRLAHVPDTEFERTRHQLKRDIHLYEHDSGALIVALMVHGN